MKLKQRTIVTALLGLSAGLLATLIPGGPIENRDFSHINPSILMGFNVFLTSLDLGTLVPMLFTFRGHAWALSSAFYVALAYYAVYAIDLAQVFPKSPTPMSPALAGVEVLGLTASVPLMIYSRYVVFNEIAKPIDRLPKWVKVIGVGAVLMAGIFVTWFATDAAMQSGSSH